MRSFLTILMMIGFVALASGYGTGCRQSTKVDVEDDEEGVEHSGPYAADAKEVTAYIVKEVKRQKLIENFKADYKEPPIVALITPTNNTRFPEITEYFQEDLLTALNEVFTRDQMRFVIRESEVLSEVEREKIEKEAGEYTDRTGRRTKLGADYFLRAKFTSLSVTDGETSDDTVKYSYEFIDTETSELIFKSSRDIRRVSDTNAVYR
ncbi:MAG: hypothetical protein IPK87_16335 [Planctomycetes bacterium]|nr:hypothetical protein [Planctomycetota bacterium]